MKKIVDQTFDFVGKRKAALVLSAILLTIALGSIIFKGFNLGLDFTGGTLVQLKFEQTPDATLIRDMLTKAEFKDVTVQKFGADKSLLIRVQPQAGKKPSDIGDQVYSVVRASMPDTILKRVEFVGPKVGKELTEQGGLATIVALIGILMYVMFRFEYRFALGAVLALMHDVLLTLGVFSLFAIEFDLTVLAAVLAVIGYSLNDTIVVYDRIRENFRKLRKMVPEEITNLSLNQTLSRTLVTSFTTLFVLISLFYFGGELIHGFSIALIIGVLVGTYSSIYVASSLILALGISRADLVVPEVKEGEEAEDEIEEIKLHGHT